MRKHIEKREHIEPSWAGKKGEIKGGLAPRRRKENGEVLTFFFGRIRISNQVQKGFEIEKRI